MAKARIKNKPEQANSTACSCSGLDEFQLFDRLASMVGVAAPESQEERNLDTLFKRRVLRKTINALEIAWAKTKKRYGDVKK